MEIMALVFDWSAKLGLKLGKFVHHESAKKVRWLLLVELKNVGVVYPSRAKKSTVCAKRTGRRLRYSRTQVLGSSNNLEGRLGCVDGNVCHENLKAVAGKRIDHWGSLKKYDVQMVRRIG